VTKWGDYLKLDTSTPVWVRWARRAGVLLLALTFFLGVMPIGIILDNGKLGLIRWGIMTPAIAEARPMNVGFEIPTTMDISVLHKTVNEEEQSTISYICLLMRRKCQVLSRGRVTGIVADLDSNKLPRCNNTAEWVTDMSVVGACGLPLCAKISIRGWLNLRAHMLPNHPPGAFPVVADMVSEQHRAVTPTVDLDEFDHEVRTVSEVRGTSHVRVNKDVDNHQRDVGVSNVSSQTRYLDRGLIAICVGIGLMILGGELILENATLFRVIGGTVFLVGVGVLSYGYLWIS
jgi:hypothetical protein